MTPARDTAASGPPANEPRDFLLGLYERMVLIRAFEEREGQVPEDRREVVVVVPTHEDGCHAIAEEPQDLLDLDPLVREVAGELVLEVACDDDLLRLHAVQHPTEALQDHAPLEARDGDALLREGALEPEVQVGDHEGALVAEKEGEVARDLHALGHLEAVHRREQRERAR